MTDPIDEADRLEQEVAISDDVGPATPVGDDVDEADAAEQRVAVPHDEDDAPR